MTDLYEGLGLVLNEAASMGLPIIVTDRVGSALDFVINGINGYIIKSGDVKELSSKIIEILINDDKLRKYSSSSRKIFENYHKEQLINQNILNDINEKI